jgi:peptidoglycan/LPS O-acetylase OafA/YrhL
VALNFNLLPGQIDYLAFGAFLALIERDYDQEFCKRISMFLIFFGCLGFFVLLFVQSRLGWLNHTCLAMVCCGVVYFASVGFRGWIGRALLLPQLMYLGRISYGVYIFHMFAPTVWLWFFWKCPIPGYRVVAKMGLSPSVYESPSFLVVVWFSITVASSAASWCLFESRFVALKKFVGYRSVNGHSDCPVA